MVRFFLPVNSGGFFQPLPFFDSVHVELIKTFSGRNWRYRSSMINLNYNSYIYNLFFTLYMENFSDQTSPLKHFLLLQQEKECCLWWCQQRYPILAQNHASEAFTKTENQAERSSADNALFPGYTHSIILDRWMFSCEEDSTVLLRRPNWGLTGKLNI